MRWLMLLLSACSQGDPTTCRLDNFALSDVKDQAATSCGSLTLDADAGFSDTVMQAARDCVLDAVTRKQPFTLFYDVANPSQHLRAGFTGAVDKGGTLRLRSYAYVGDSSGGSSDSRPVLTAKTCEGIGDSGCAPSAGKPCLSCLHPGAATTLCRY